MSRNSDTVNWHLYLWITARRAPAAEHQLKHQFGGAGRGARPTLEHQFGGGRAAAVAELQLFGGAAQRSRYRPGAELEADVAAGASGALNAVTVFAQRAGRAQD